MLAVQKLQHFYK